MKYGSVPLDKMTIDELTEYIINKLDIKLQLEIVGYEYYQLYINFDEDKRKDLILSSLKQMPEDIILNIIKNAKTR